MIIIRTKKNKLDAEEYLCKIDGKEHYVWDSKSIFGNQVPVRIVKEGMNSDMGMERPISAVLVILKIINQEGFIRNMVALPSQTPLQQVLFEINNIVQFAENDSKKYHTEVGEAIEVHLVPDEFYNQFK